ncbi:alpha/beta fold hydrolase [Pseudoalteromonas sp. Of11M-6]|uniref:alpha/beta hydrolase n=1 Tax=Pseudoalteromonas sp. Of11M-6 TaxID=2917754 RepID=UPI001EF4B1B3|nr:alpha/beta fold hydrolase [Pseudoalteromonas sp. Of11M-6]MCG7555273.1 alpha/beta fold hydrolase [Pseudoalteromonas sp. Of11M-6]
MRHYLTSTVFAFSLLGSPLVIAQDCVTQVSDMSLFTKSKASGLFREAIDKGPVTVDIGNIKNYNDYIRSTKQIIESRNPRATLPCPLMTPTAKILNLTNPKVSDLIAPFSLEHDNKDHAILLIHGLTDSPFTFHYLAAALYEAGYNVRTMLLPGHATAPSDLTEVDIDDWQTHTDYAIAQTSQDFKHFSVLGYSTGAAIVLSSIAKHKPNNLGSVALISPATEPHNKNGWLAKWIDYVPFVNWIDEDADLDFAKYESFPWHGATLAHQAMAPLKSLTTLPDVPMFISYSDVDTTIDNHATAKLLEKWQPKSTLTQFIYSETPSTKQGVNYRSVKADNIVDMSHIGILQPPEHIFYGSKGPYRNCTSYHLEDQAFINCRTGKTVHFGERHEKSMTQYTALARITFNPDYSNFEQALLAFFDGHND